MAATVDSVPRSVRRAALSLWISAALGVLVTVAQATGLVATVGASVAMTLVIGLVTVGLLVFVAINVARGRGWVRWLFAVVYVVGTLAGVLLVAVAPAMFRVLPTILQTNMVVQFVLQTSALVLMFTAASRHWFMSRNVSTPP